MIVCTLTPDPAQELAGSGNKKSKSGRNHSPQDSDTDKAALFARGQLKNAAKVFAHRQWNVLPQGRRGQKILRWGADHAWLASPNPERSARNWVRRWAPWLKGAALEQFLAETETSNKRWSHDESATVLEITVTDREDHKLWFLGADDDHDYTKRQKIQRAKNAAKSRKFRAAHSTGAKRGRPGLQLSEEDKLARRRAQDAERKRAERERRKAAHVTLKSVPLHNSSNKIVDRDTNIDGGTQFSVTQDRLSRSRQAARRAPERAFQIIDIDGTIIDLDDDDLVDPDEHAPCAGAPGATNPPTMERRA